MTLDTHTSAHPSTAAVVARSPSFGDLYLELLRPDRNGQKRLQEVGAAAMGLDPAIPDSGAALEQLFSQTLGGKVQLTEPQLQAFKCLTDTPALAELSPWKQQLRHTEHEEMVSASDLHEIYLALLKPDGGHQQRFKSLQAAVALYEPGTPASQDAIEQELSRLIGRRVQLNEPQARCIKELMVDEPAFAHIAPWVDLTASW